MTAPAITTKVAQTYRTLKSRGLTEQFTFVFAGDIDEDDYNPVTGEFSLGPTTTTVVEGVVLSRKRAQSTNLGSTPKFTIEALFDSADVGDLTVYDSITFNGDLYGLEAYDDNLYVVSVTMTKEV